MLSTQRYYERKARKKREAEEAAKKSAPKQKFNNGWDDENCMFGFSFPRVCLFVVVVFLHSVCSFVGRWALAASFQCNRYCTCAIADDLLIQPGEALGDHYRMISVLGKGSFGQVVKAEDRRTQEMCAIKIIKSKRPFFEQARTEISVLSHLNQRDPTDQFNIGM